MDNAATTKISKEVLRAMEPYLNDFYGNPSSQYEFGQISRKAIKKAREQTAEAIGAEPDEVIFTSGGTESDNLAIKGVCEYQAARGKYKIITTNIEHPAVLNSCSRLEKHGFKVTYLPVNEDGFVTPEQVRLAIDDKTAIVSVMFANNEIGTIQPIAEIGAICREHDVPFHVDAVQAVGSVDIDVQAMNIDLMSISGHKIHAQKGVGCLYVKSGTVMNPIIDGGGQEKGVRSGTENVASIAGFGVAIQNAAHRANTKKEYVTKLRDCFIKGLMLLPDVIVNGSTENRLCGNVNVSFRNQEGESIVLRLSTCGICASAKSACDGGSLKPSHVITAIGCSEDYLYGTVRFSLDEDNTEAEIGQVLEELRKVVNTNGE